jgi:hypothetical protein
MVRWLALTLFAVACAGGSSCPRPARRFEIPLDTSGCACTPTKRSGDYPLDCVCKTGRCPRDVADGLALVRGACEAGEEHRAYRSQGCGHIALLTTNGLCGVNFVYEASSSKLIAGDFWCDLLPTPGSCDHAYGFGAPIADCPDLEVCRVCGNDDEVAACDEAQRCGP